MNTKPQQTSPTVSSAQSLGASVLHAQPNESTPMPLGQTSEETERMASEGTAGTLYLPAIEAAGWLKVCDRRLGLGAGSVTPGDVSKSRSEKGSDPLRRGQPAHNIDSPPKGQTPFPIGPRPSGPLWRFRTELADACWIAQWTREEVRLELDRQLATEVLLELVEQLSCLSGGASGSDQTAEDVAVLEAIVRAMSAL